MKISKLFTGFIMGCLILSCSSDDDSNTVQDELTGTWSLISVENQGNDIPVFGCGTDQTITYSTNNRGEEYFPEDYDASPCQFSTIGFDWNRNGNLLIKTVDFDEGTNVTEILLLNENQLQTVIIERNGISVLENEREIFKYQK